VGLLPTNLHDPGILSGFFLEETDPASGSILLSTGKILTRDGRVLYRLNLPTVSLVGQLVMQRVKQIQITLDDDFPDDTVYILLRPRDYGILELDAPGPLFSGTNIAEPVGQPKIQIKNIGKKKLDSSPLERQDLVDIEIVTNLLDRLQQDFIDPLTNLTISVNASVLIGSVTLVAGVTTMVDNSIKELAN